MYCFGINKACEGSVACFTTVNVHIKVVKTDYRLSALLFAAIKLFIVRRSDGVWCSWQQIMTKAFRINSILI